MYRFWRKTIAIVITCLFTFNSIVWTDAALQPPLASYVPSDTMDVEAAIVGFLEGLGCPISEIEELRLYPLSIKGERVFFFVSRKDKQGENCIVHCKTGSEEYEVEVNPDNKILPPIRKKAANPPKEAAPSSVLDWRTQEKTQTLSIEAFSHISLGDKETDALSGKPVSFVSWCGGEGFHVNPSLTSFNLLDSAGISPHNINYLIITDPNFTINKDFLERIRTRERRGFITTRDIFDKIIAEASAIEGKEFDVRKWFDFVLLEPNVVTTVKVPEGNVNIEIHKVNGGRKALKINYQGKTLGYIPHLDKTEPLTDIFWDEDGNSLVDKLLTDNDMQMFDGNIFIKRDEENRKQWLKNFLAKTSLLGHIDKKDREIVAYQGKIQSFMPGEVVVKKGEESDACYIVISGEAEVVQAKWPLKTLDFFGELGVEANEPRNASIRAKTFLKVLRIDKEVYTAHVANPLRGVRAFNEAKYNLETWIQEMVPGISITATSLDEIVLRAPREIFRGIVEGQRGDCAYILMEGNLEVTKKDPQGRQVHLAHLEPFSLFGQMALLSPSALRTATVKPIRAARVLKISRELFDFILNKYPGLDKGIKEEIIRLRCENRKLLARSRKVSTPRYLLKQQEGALSHTDIILNLRSFFDRLKIELFLEGISDTDLEEYAPNLEIIHGILKEIFGEALLERGCLNRIVVSQREMEDVLYVHEDRTIYIPKRLFDLDGTSFTNKVLTGLSEVILHYLYEEEFLEKEKQMLERAVDIIVKNSKELETTFLADELPILFEEEAGAREVLANLFRLYIVKPNQLRDLMKPQSALNLPLKGALKTIYNLYKEASFLGKEYTRRKPPTAIRRRKPPTTRIEKQKWNTLEITEKLENIINQVLNDSAASSSSLFRQEFYEVEVYQKLKLEILRKLAEEFTYFNLQRFYDDLIEISVYQPQHKTRVVVRARRFRKNKLYRWKIGDASQEEDNVTVTKKLASPPVNISLVNLESPQFGGVKGTPENVKTLQAYLETHRKGSASISLFDNQWPENDIDFLLDETHMHTPDILAISATFGCLIKLEKVLNELNRLRNKPLVVIGGLMSTYSYEYILGKYPEVICVQYEGEEAFTKIVDLVAEVPSKNVREVIKDKLSGISNLAFIEDGRIRVIPRKFVDLSKVPPPSRKTQMLRQMQAKWLLNSEGIGRGCGYGGCFFCTRTHGKLRPFAPERGLADYKAYMEGGAPFVTYVDEDFLLGPKFARQLIRLRENYRRQRLEEGEADPVLPSFYLAVRARTIYEEGDDDGNRERLETLRLFKEAGLVKVFLGGESGSAVQFRKTYHKQASIPEVKKAIDIIKGEGVQVAVGFITFDPVVSLHQLQENLDFMKKKSLVYVDKLTEPLNPFKYYRAQVDSTTTRQLRDVGLLASSMDPDTLMYDTVYRNPLVRVITGIGDVWKNASDELAYHLKGVLWYAEQSEEETEKARLFVDLFNSLRQKAFHLIEELIELQEREQLEIDKEETIKKFMDSLRGLPEEKILFEVGRVMFPHRDMFGKLKIYISAHIDDAGFDLCAFITEFLKGNFPPDFDFGKSSTATQYRQWLKDVRTDICQQMLNSADLEKFIKLSEGILRKFLAERKKVLEEFSRSSWKDYYQEYPEAVARGREFQAVLNETLSQHEAMLESSIEARLLSTDMLSIQPYNIYWRATLGDFLSYRHPDLSRPLGVLIKILHEVQTSPNTHSLDLEKIYVYKDLTIKYTAGAASSPVIPEFAKGEYPGSIKYEQMDFARKCMEKLFMNGSEVNANYFEDLLRIYLDLTKERFSDLTQLTAELVDLYRQAAQGRTISVEGIKVESFPISLDGKCEARISSSGLKYGFTAHGNYIPTYLVLDFISDYVKVGKGGLRVTDPEQFKKLLSRLWKKILQDETGLTEQEKFNTINASVEIFSQYTDSDEWQEELASLIDREVSPMTVYLPDEEKYLSWPRKYPDVKFIYVHPQIYHRAWPGIEKHLEDKIIILAQPHTFDDFEVVLNMVKEEKVSLPWARFVYEAFFNRIRPEAFGRNEDPENIIRQYTTIFQRVMPKKTPVLLLDKEDARLEIFPSHHEDVNHFMQDGEKVRLVIHPQVYEGWKNEGNLPFEKETFQWSLVYPTASCRTLYVLDSDIIAKTHSRIKVGPAERRLKRDNVTHSVEISERICSTIVGEELPPNMQDGFAYIDESGVVLNDPSYYPEGIGAIYRSSAAYPVAQDEKRILIPLFAFHNNAINIEENRMPDVLAQLIKHNVSKTGEDEIEFFIRKILRPLYRMFDYFIFKQGILLEPHGQNLFVEIDEEGRVRRLVFKDWQSTMVDMETIIRRDLLHADFEKHLLGEEAGIPCSLSLVFDHYFGHYLFEQIINTLVEEYHDNMHVVEYRERLTARFKGVFEEELGLYSERRDEFPDSYVRHDNEKKKADDKRRKEEGLPPTNDVPFRTDGAPGLRPTTFEREIQYAIEEGVSSGKMQIELKFLKDDKADIAIVDEEPTITVDLERTTLESGYFRVLPPNFDPDREYPLLVFLHGMNSSVMEILSWVENIGIEDAIVLVPFGAHITGKNRFSWFTSGLPAEVLKEKETSHRRLAEIVDKTKKSFNITECVIGGLSQGGHMALFSTLTSPETFNHVFAVNTPFKKEYLPPSVIPASPSVIPAKAGIYKNALLLHIETDEVVNVAHSERQEAFLNEKGFNVIRHLYASGMHHKLSSVMAEDIHTWLQKELKLTSGTVSEKVPPTSRVKKLAGKVNPTPADITRLNKIFYEIGHQRKKGYESIFYDILLDPVRPFTSRLTSLSALEKLKFTAISEGGGEITFLSRIRQAQQKISSVERIIAFLTAHMASREELSPEMLTDFNVMISSFRRNKYLFKKYAAQSEETIKKEKFLDVLREAEWRYDFALDLQRKLVAEIRETVITSSKTVGAASGREQTILRDISDPEQLALCLLEETLSLKINKEVVLAFDSNIAAGQEGEAFQQFLKALEILKGHPKYGRFLQNLVIVSEDSPKKLRTELAKHTGKKNTEIFMFAKTDIREQLIDIEHQVYPVYIDEGKGRKKFDPNLYYPLAEIVVITLAHSIVPSIIKEGDPVTTLKTIGAELNLRDLNIESIDKEGMMLGFKLHLPKATKHSPQDAISRYIALKRFLKAA